MILLLQMQEIGDTLTNNPDKEPSVKEIREFYDNFIPILVMIDEMTTQVNDLRDNLDRELELQRFDLSK